MSRISSKTSSVGSWEQNKRDEKKRIKKRGRGTDLPMKKRG